MLPRLSHPSRHLNRAVRAVPFSRPFSRINHLGTRRFRVNSYPVACVTVSKSSKHLESRRASSVSRQDDGSDEVDKDVATMKPWLRQLWNDNQKNVVVNSDASASGKMLNLDSSAGNLASPPVTPPTDNVNDAMVVDIDVDDDMDFPGSSLQPDPKHGWPIDPALYPHVRACLSDVEFESSDLASRDTGLSLCTLGTGAGNSTKLRSNTCTVVKNGSTSYLIDAGEGLQRQFMTSRISFRDVRKIFITHLHGDHVFGLPGFLLNAQVASLNANKAHSIEMYGPVGLYNYIATALSLTNTELRKLTVEVYELQGGTQRSMRQAANRKTFPEFHHKGLYRKVIPQNADGTWTLAEPLEISTPELAIKYYSRPVGLSVKAAEIHHVPQLQCFGYTFQEPLTQPRSLDVEAARALGVTSSISYRMLKSGFPVYTEDKTRQVSAEAVCGEVPRPRKITVLGDCCLVPPAMEMLAMNSDVLVHEATLAITDKGNKVAAGGHSSAAQAAVFANKVKAKVLILNHLPKKVSTYKGVKDCLGEAESRIRGPTKVQLAYDHLEVLIPRKGFDFDETTPAKSLWLHERVGLEAASEAALEVDVQSQHGTPNDSNERIASIDSRDEYPESALHFHPGKQVIDTTEASTPPPKRPSRRIRKLMAREDDTAA